MTKEMGEKETKKVTILEKLITDLVRATLDILYQVARILIAWCGMSSWLVVDYLWGACRIIGHQEPAFSRSDSDDTEPSLPVVRIDLVVLGR